MAEAPNVHVDVLKRSESHPLTALRAHRAAVARSLARSLICLGASCALLNLSQPSDARAGNDDGILVGTEAALNGGAVTATVSDGAAAWYNPAGLAQQRRQSFDINASTYGISRSSTDNLVTLPDSTESEASVVDWQLVPSVLSYARELAPRLVGSFGVLVPVANDQDLRAAVQEGNGTQWVVGVDSYRTNYAYALSLAGRTTESFRWGVSLHGVYLSSEEMVQFGTGKSDDASEFRASLSSHRTSSDYGARLAAGVQWDVGHGLALGLSGHSPTLTAFRRVADDDVAIEIPGGAADEAIFTASHQEDLLSLWELSTPLMLRAGAAYAFQRVALSIDGSFLSKLETTEDSLDRKYSGNIRVGCTVQTSETLTVGVGAFTDRSGTIELAPNFVGVAGGLKFGRNLQLRDGSPLSFVTSLALRYAHGWGRAEGLAILDRAGIIEIKNVAIDVRVHELAINLGGGVTF